MQVLCAGALHQGQQLPLCTRVRVGWACRGANSTLIPLEMFGNVLLTFRTMSLSAVKQGVPATLCERVSLGCLALELTMVPVLCGHKVFGGVHCGLRVHHIMLCWGHHGVRGEMKLCVLVSCSSGTGIYLCGELTFQMIGGEIWKIRRALGASAPVRWAVLIVGL